MGYGVWGIFIWFRFKFGFLNENLTVSIFSWWKCYEHVSSKAYAYSSMNKALHMFKTIFLYTYISFIYKIHHTYIYICIYIYIRTYNIYMWFDKCHLEFHPTSSKKRDSEKRKTKKKTTDWAVWPSLHLWYGSTLVWRWDWCGGSLTDKCHL